MGIRRNRSSHNEARRIAAPWLAAAALLAFCSAAPALDVDGVAFAPEHRAGASKLVLNNAALLRYRIVIKAYVAALYLGEGAEPEQVLADVPKRLEIEYFWGIRAPDFAEATNAGIRKNVDAATFERLRPRIERLNALYRDVIPGDRYALTYVPGTGTELALNGKPLGTVEGNDFAAALFAIWLGDEPLDASLKQRLLARR